MSQTPVHDYGTLSPLPSETIATFPIGTFLENIAVRSNGTLLISDMTGGKVYYLDPSDPNPQSTLVEIHNFNGQKPTVGENEGSAYGSGIVATAIVEDSLVDDLFYVIAGQHGTSATWAVHTLDFSSFDPRSNASFTVKKLIEVPDAIWLNGSTMLPRSNTLLIAESLQSQLIAVHIPTLAVKVWLSDKLLGKITDRQPWPGANGVQFYNGKVFITNSDRAIVLVAELDAEDEFKEDSLKIVAKDITGDDLAFDTAGNAFIATNPAQTVAKFAELGTNLESLNSGRETMLGGPDIRETAGPTAVAFGRGSPEEERKLYVVTTGGLVVPVNGELDLARVVRVDVGAA